MIVYHGSTLCVENPLVGVCLDNLDFGKGFYLTDICEQAISWAKRVAITGYYHLKPTTKPGSTSLWLPGVASVVGLIMT